MEKVCIRSLVESGSLESRRYYLARRTLIEMLRDRGYVVPDIEVQLRLSLAEFRAAFGDQPEAERLRISAVHLCRCCCHKSPTLSLTLSRTPSRISTTAAAVQSLHHRRCCCHKLPPSVCRSVAPETALILPSLALCSSTKKKKKKKKKKRVISLQTLSLTAALCAPSAAPPACCHLLWAVCCAGVCEETPTSMADVKAVDEGGGLLDKRKVDLPKSINKAPEDEKDKDDSSKRQKKSKFPPPKTAQFHPPPKTAQFHSPLVKIQRNRRTT